MALEDVLGALSNNKELADEVKGIYEANTGNVERIGTLESELNEAIDKKSKVLNLVRTNLGISEVSAEALQPFSTGVDEAIKADNAALQEKLELMSNKLVDTENGYKKEIDTMVLKDTLRGLGIADRTANEVAFNELTSIILAEAQRDGSQFVFKDEEGRTRFTDNGKPMTVSDRIDEISTGDRSYLFSKSVGGGTPPSGGKQGNTAPAQKGVAAYVTDLYL